MLIVATGGGLDALHAQEPPEVPPEVPPQDAEETWQVIQMLGQRVGYLHARTWETEQNGERRIWSESFSQMTINRFGNPLTMTVRQTTEEDPRGNLHSFVYELDNPPASHSVTTGRVAGDVLKLQTVSGGQTTEQTRDWDPEVKSPAYQDRLLQEQPLQPGAQQSFRIFDPQMVEFATLELKGEPPAETELLDGSTRTLPAVTIRHSLLPLVTIRAFLNEEGETLKTETSLLGLETFTVPKEEALKAIEGAEIDLAASTMVRVEPLADAHQTRRVVYEISAPGARLAERLPAGPTQQVEADGDDAIRLTVTALKPQGDVSADDVADAYLSSSQYLNLQDEALIEHAHKAAGDLTQPAEIAIAMERYVDRQVRSKNFSTALASASEVARSLEGDCTEHAMLLAAMLRVKGIPSRVAIGLVYSERNTAFVGHMWTEAHLGGAWTPLDATFGEGGIGAAHIKFADTGLGDDGAPLAAFVPLVELLGRMKIRVLSSE